MNNWKDIQLGIAIVRAALQEDTETAKFLMRDPDSGDAIMHFIYMVLGCYTELVVDEMNEENAVEAMLLVLDRMTNNLIEQEVSSHE